MEESSVSKMDKSGSDYPEGEHSYIVGALITVKTEVIDHEYTTDITPSPKSETFSQNDTSRDKFVCATCSKSFGRYFSLRRHARYVHENKIFTCRECDKNFRSKSDLETHKQIVHEGRHFMCDQCGKSFRSKYGMTMHRRTHDRPQYPCSLCSQDFSYKDGLRAHMNSKHGAQNLYTCKDCGKSMAHSSSLSQHKKSCTIKQKFACSICDKQFIQQRYLKAHTKQSHGNVYPYRCSKCGQSYRYRHSRIKHERNCSS